MKYLKNYLQKYELKPEQLRWTCSPDAFKKTANNYKPLEEIVSQERAVKAIKRGLEIELPGWNIYAAGISGTGRTSIIRKILEELEKDDVPDDICYVHNFTNKDKPITLKFSAGKGLEFKNDVENLIGEMKDYITLKTDLLEEKQKKISEAFQSQVLKRMEKLPISASKEEINKDPVIVKLRKETSKKLNNLQKETEEESPGIEKFLFSKQESLIKKYLKSNGNQIKVPSKNDTKLQRYINDLCETLLEDYKRNPSLFDKKIKPQSMGFLQMDINTEDLFKIYNVNLFVDNSKLKKRPIITEINPTFSNLIGKIEKWKVEGGYTTDFTMIKPGAVHKAKGGYLILDAFELLTKPYSWEALKKVLKTGKLKIKDVDEEAGISMNIKTLEPESINIDTKIIMIGDPWIHYLLEEYDEDYKELFKIKAEFQSKTKRSEETLENLAKFTSFVVKQNNLLDFDNTALAALAEYCVKLTENKKNISLQFGKLRDLIIESNVVAKNNKKDKVSRGYVEQAIKDKINRENLTEEKYREFIDRYILIDTEGKKIGEMNGLAVLCLSENFEFGVVNKITATTSHGDEGIISIDKEAELTGSFTDKGYEVLEGFLREKFGQDKGISLTAKICFEQEYGVIDGDSASSTQLYTILSSLSDVPLKQILSNTGSVNQKGMIQAIGGVNAKIEGFFDLCNTRGLTGDQGVMIPQKNVQDLMLDDKVINAVKKDKFHIYAVETIDQGLEVLTGVKAEEIYKLADEKLMKFHLIENDEYKKKKRRKKTRKEKQKKK